MRLYEIMLPSLYLGSKVPLTPGEIVNEPHAYPLGGDFELCLDNRKPVRALPRSTSLHLYANPHQDAEYVYAVQPLGQIDRHHTSWLKKLRRCKLLNKGETDQYARGYWSDNVIPEDRNAPWEYLAAEAKVLRRVGGKALMTVPTPEGLVCELLRGS